MQRLAAVAALLERHTSASSTVLGLRLGVQWLLQAAAPRAGATGLTSQAAHWQLTGSSWAWQQWLQQQQQQHYFSSEPLAGPQAAPEPATSSSEQQHGSSSTHKKRSSRAGLNGSTSNAGRTNRQRDHSESQHIRLIRKRGAKGDIEGCLDQLAASPSTFACNVALRSLRGNLPGALAVLDYMRQRNLSPDSFSAACVADALAAAGASSRERWAEEHEVDDVMERLEAMPSVAPHNKCYLSWADAHAVAGRPEAVRRVMLRALSRGLDLLPHYFTMLIKALCKARRDRDAEAVLDEMQMRGLRPGEEVYRALIFCHGRSGHPQRAAEVFNRMRAAGLRPTVATYGALINAYAEANMPEQAVAILRDMHRAGVRANLQTYSALIKAFARAGDVDRARAVLTVMRREGISPNDKCYGAVVDACAVAGRPGAARQALQDMRAAGWRPTLPAWTSLLSAYSVAGDVGRAAGVLQEMRAAGVEPNLLTYTELMSAMAWHGMHDEVGQVLSQLQQQGLRPDAVCYQILIDAKLNRWQQEGRRTTQFCEEAQRLFEDAKQRELQVPSQYIPSLDALRIDLHGYSSWTAQLVVLDVLSSLQRQHAAGKPVPNLHIVTGRGNKSARRNQAVLRELVLALLQPLVGVALSRHNDGMLEVPRGGLARLFSLLLLSERGSSLAPGENPGLLLDPASLRQH